MTDEELRAAGLPEPTKTKDPFLRGLFAGLGIGAAAIGVALALLFLVAAGLFLSVVEGSLDFLVEALWGR